MDQSLIKKEDMTAMAGGKDATITVLIIDRSGSMQGKEEAVLSAVNNHLKAIKNPPDSREQFCTVITFADKYRIDVKLNHASQIQQMDSYNPNGSTLLWKTVYKTIKLFLEPYTALSAEKRKKLKIFVGVFSDGEDNSSNESGQPALYPEKLQSMAKKALQKGFEFLTFGFGVDVKKIAGNMGFPTDDNHAFQFAKSTAGIAKAGEAFTHITTVTGFDGSRFDPGTGKKYRKP